MHRLVCFIESDLAQGVIGLVVFTLILAGIR